MLQLNQIVCGYGEIEVLRGVDLHVQEGRFTLLIGPNGAGKSTVLKTIFGLLTPRSGSIVYRGKDITGAGPRENLRNRICYLPQGRCNFPMMTVEENLHMAAYSRNDRNIKSDIEALLERYPVLAQKRKQLAGALSGGQQQLMEMAMAQLLKPDLLLIDEPSIGLSPALVKQTFEDLKDIQRDGCTILMVEQNVKAALAVADWVSVLELGRVRLDGEPQQVMEDPRLKSLYLGGAVDAGS